METQSIMMLIVGVGLLYGGLAWCIGIAWYHTKRLKNGRGNSEKQDPDSA